MKGNEKSPLEGFLEIAREDRRRSREKINENLLEQILRTSEEFDKVQSNELKRKNVVNELRTRLKGTDLNEVFEIYIYCQKFMSTNEVPVPTPSILCINVGKNFTHKNLHEVASRIYIGEQIESGCALTYLIYLAIYDEHSSYVLDFIKDNFEGFSHNNKTDCVFLLKDLLPDNEVAQQIVNDSGIVERKLIFSSSVESSSKPITFKLGNHENENNSAPDSNQNTERNDNSARKEINEEINSLIEKMAKVYREKSYVDAMLLMPELDPKGNIVQSNFRDVVDLYLLENMEPKNISEQKSKIEVLEMLASGLPDEGHEYLETFAFTECIEQQHAMKLFLTFLPMEHRKESSMEKLRTNFSSLPLNIQEGVEGFLKALFPDEDIFFSQPKMKISNEVEKDDKIVLEKKWWQFWK